MIFITLGSLWTAGSGEYDWAATASMTAEGAYYSHSQSGGAYPNNDSYRWRGFAGGV